MAFDGGTLGLVRAFFTTDLSYPYDTWQEIPHILEATPPSAEDEEVDSTEFKDDFTRTSIFGLRKINVSTLKCNPDLADDGVHRQLITAAKNRTTVRYRYEIAVDADPSITKWFVYEMDARVATPGPDSPLDALKTLEFRFSNAANWKQFDTNQESVRD